MFKAYIHSILLVAFLLLRTSEAAVALCTEPPCELNLGQTCKEALDQQNLYGSCCSLKDIDGDCIMTVLGESAECNYREPGYVCVPEEGCLVEFNQLVAMIPGSECPASDYMVPMDPSGYEVIPMPVKEATDKDTKKKGKEKKTLRGVKCGRRTNQHCHK